MSLKKVEEPTLVVPEKIILVKFKKDRIRAEMNISERRKEVHQEMTIDTEILIIVELHLEGMGATTKILMLAKIAKKATDHVTSLKRKEEGLTFRNMDHPQEEE